MKRLFLLIVVSVLQRNSIFITANQDIDALYSLTAFFQGHALCMDNNSLSEESPVLNVIKTDLLSLTNCLYETNIFDVSKEEYMKHMDKCKQNLTTYLISCLRDSDQFILDVFSDLDKNRISFFYDYNPNTHEELKNCYENRLILPQMKMCVDNVPSVNYFSMKEAICGPYALYSFCFADTLVRMCDRSNAIEKISAVARDVLKCTNGS